MLKIFILTDLEGAAGVDRWSQTGDADSDPGQTAIARRLLTAEVNACVDGILAAAPKAEVVVWDGHGCGGLLTEEIHPRVKLITGLELGPPYCLDSSYDAVFFVGQHAMAGTKDATLCHTYNHKTVEYHRLNGITVGEFGARAFMASTLGVPTVFISGDDKAVEEARKLIPSIYGAAVKTSLLWQAALHLAPAAARNLIRETAARAVRGLGKIEPPVIKPPFEHEIRVYEGSNVDWYIRRGYTKKDGRTAVMVTDDICKLTI